MQETERFFWFVFWSGRLAAFHCAIAELVVRFGSSSEHLNPCFKLGQSRLLFLFLFQELGDLRTLFANLLQIQLYSRCSADVVVRTG